MPTYHEAVAALPAGLVDAVKQLIRDLTVRRMAYVVADSSEVPDLVAVDPASGAAILVITSLGREYLYDPTDTTTAHDGTSCLVSYEGRRYKLATGTDIVVYAVINNTTTVPPSTPVNGDAYLVAAGATGAWSGHSDQIAVYTSHGWEFVTPSIGRFVYVKDTDSYYHKNSGGTLVAGFGSQSLAANAVPLSALINKPVRHFIENQTTNAPPGTAAVGVAYVIGSSPTGAWSGNAGKLAICEVVNTFTIYTPRTGELAYDKNLAKDIQWSGTAWVPGANAMVLIASYTFTGSTMSITGVMDNTYDTYIMKLANIKVSSDSAEIRLVVGTGSTPTYQTASNSYRWGSNGAGSDGVGWASGNDGTGTSISLVHPGQGVGNAAGENFNASLEFNNPEVTDFFHVAFRSYYNRADDKEEQLSGSGRYTTAGAVTAIRFTLSAGSFASGNGYLYGLRKA